MNEYVVMAQHHRRPHFLPVLSDYHPAIDRKPFRPVLRLPRQGRVQRNFIISASRFQTAVESGDCGKVTVLGITNVHTELLYWRLHDIYIGSRQVFQGYSETWG